MGLSATAHRVVLPPSTTQMASRAKNSRAAITIWPGLTPSAPSAITNGTALLTVSAFMVA